LDLRGDDIGALGHSDRLKLEFLERKLPDRHFRGSNFVLYPHAADRYARAVIFAVRAGLIYSLGAVAVPALDGKSEIERKAISFQVQPNNHAACSVFPAPKLIATLGAVAHRMRESEKAYLAFSATPAPRRISPIDG
jgi:hypothetical protein